MLIATLHTLIFLLQLPPVTVIGLEFLKVLERQHYVFITCTLTNVCVIHKLFDFVWQCAGNPLGVSTHSNI